MPQRSAVASLPPEMKAWLDRELVENNFAGYQLLADELKARGYVVSKSAVHRYGQEFEERLAALKVASEQAKAIVEAAPDNEGAINEALMRLIQEKLFSVLQDVQVDPKKINLASLGKTVAELARASVAQKKFAEEVRKQERELARAEAAEAASQATRQLGLSDDQAAFIRAEILGVQVEP